MWTEGEEVESPVQGIRLIVQPRGIARAAQLRFVLHLLLLSQLTERQKETSRYYKSIVNGVVLRLLFLFVIFPLHHHHHQSQWSISNIMAKLQCDLPN